MNHNEIAQVWLRESDKHLEDCDDALTKLEERLAQTPKPSEVLEWRWR